MMLRKTALTAAILLNGSPAFAQNNVDDYVSRPKPIIAIPIGARSVNIVAVTQRARANTAMRREYLKERKVFSKVVPGYPQPAFVSIDFQVKF